MSIDRSHHVLIYVQHLLGIGHLQRALGLARALLQQGFEVDLVSGGKPLDRVPDGDIRLHQLPPAHSPDGSFSRIHDAADNPVDASWKAQRREQLLDLFDRLAPGVLITETFPFGRRMMAFELIPLLDRAQDCEHEVCVIASIRDILQPKTKPGREQEIVERIEAYYDHVLVHGDAAIAGLETSFSAAAEIADKLFYSGYITDESRATANADTDIEVLVSAGGSATGLEVLQTAIAARPGCRLADARWRVLVSPAFDQEVFDRLSRDAGDGVVVERNRSDFKSLMRGARLSISQAGYNTMTDILSSGVPAVVVPFADAGEIEQSLRARIFAEHRRVVNLEATDLNAGSMAAAIDASATLDLSLAVDLDGAANSARQIANWVGGAGA